MEILEVASRIHDRFDVEVIGEADPDVEPHLRAAVSKGLLTWRGFLPNEEALEHLSGALVGLSLIHPQPNHAGSLQTKVLEYLSRRVPVISTDLPVTGAFVREHGVGITVCAGDVQAVVDAVERLAADEEERRAMADRGFRLIDTELNWEIVGERFVAHLRQVGRR